MDNLIKQRLTKIAAANGGSKTRLSKEWNPVQVKYRPKALIGQGQYGQVIRAKCKLTGKTVAIKMIKVKRDNLKAVKHAVREVRLLEKLTALEGNSFTVKLRDCFTSQGCSGFHLFFLVMDYVPLSLDTVLENKQALGLGQAQISRIFKSIVKAVGFLHSAGVMHRDLKPTNILIDSDLNAKLCDFGLSRCAPTTFFNEATSASSSGSDSQNGRMARRLSQHVQTRFYRAPEVMLMQSVYDEKVDMWSLGVILADMVQSLKGLPRQSYNRLDSLFHGNSCYPLSPEGGEITNKVSSKDQLRCVLRFLGELSPADKDGLVENRRYLSKLEGREPKISFSQTFACLDPTLVQCFENLLQFNPHLRASTKSILRILDREDEEIPVAAQKVRLDIDEGEQLDLKVEKELKRIIYENVVPAVVIDDEMLQYIV